MSLLEFVRRHIQKMKQKLSLKDVQEIIARALDEPPTSRILNSEEILKLAIANHLGKPLEEVDKMVLNFREEGDRYYFDFIPPHPVKFITMKFDQQLQGLDK